MILRHDGFKFFFYANEGNRREPIHIHIHIRRDGMEAKFWLTPQVRIAYNEGFDARMQRALIAVIEANVNLIERKWDEFFA